MKKYFFNDDGSPPLVADAYDLKNIIPVNASGWVVFMNSKTAHKINSNATRALFDLNKLPQEIKMQLLLLGEPV